MNALLATVLGNSGEAFSSLAAAQSVTSSITIIDPLLWAILVLNAAPWIVSLPIALVHIVLAIAVLRDRPRNAGFVLPRWGWSVVVLSTGFVGLLAYWLIHDTAPVPKRT